MINLFLRLLILLRIKSAWKVVAILKSTYPPYERYVSCIAKGKYKREYNKGRIVIAELGTLGLLCFLTKNRAYKWMEIELVYNLEGLLGIKEVRPFGFGKRPKEVCSIPNFAIERSDERIDVFYKDTLNRIAHSEPPSQTVGYKRIKVLN